MALIKRGGQLFEDTDDTLMSRVNKLGTSTPTSPKGADGIGVSPDSAKMMGAGAQRQKALRDAVAPKEATLAGQQRLQGPAEATSADQAAQAKAQQLQQLGAMGTRVQSQIEQRIATAGQTAGTAGIQADLTGIQNALGYTPEQIAADQQAGGPNVAGQIKNLVDQYMMAPSEDLLVQMVGLGLTKDQVYSMTGMTETGAQATGRMVADAMADRLTVGELDIEGLGFGSMQELNDAMGRDVSQMTVPELQAAIDELQGAEYDRLAEIKAEIARLPQGSARRQMLMEEAAALGDVGIMSAEAAVEELVEDIDTAHEVTIGGETYTIEEILSDEGVSDLIEQYLAADEETREELFPEDTFGELRSWITENQASLNAIIESAGDTREAFEAANIEWEGMTTNLGMDDQTAAAVFGYDPEAVQTSAGVEEFKKQFGPGTEEQPNLGAGTLYSFDENGELVTDNAILSGLVNGENKDIIAGMNADEIATSNEMNTAVENNAVLSSLTGITDTSQNFLSSADTATAQQWLTTANAIRDNGFTEVFQNNETFRNAVKNGKLDASWMKPEWNTGEYPALADPLVLEMINNGTLTAENRETLLADWSTKRPAYQKAQEKDKAITDAYNSNDLDSMLDALFGTDINTDAIMAGYKQAEFAAKLGDPRSQEAVERYKTLMDKDALLAAATGGHDLMSFLKGTNKDYSPPAGASQPFEQMPTYSNLFSAAGDDGKLDWKEMFNNGDVIKRATEDGVPLHKLFASQADADKFMNSAVNDDLNSIPVGEEYRKLNTTWPSYTATSNSITSTYDKAIDDLENAKAQAEMRFGKGSQMYNDYINKIDLKKGELSRKRADAVAHGQRAQKIHMNIKKTFLENLNPFNPDPAKHKAAMDAAWEEAARQLPAAYVDQLKQQFDANLNAFLRAKF